MIGIKGGTGGGRKGGREGGRKGEKKGGLPLLFYGRVCTRGSLRKGASRRTR